MWKNSTVCNFFFDRFAVDLAAIDLGLSITVFLCVGLTCQSIILVRLKTGQMCAPFLKNSLMRNFQHRFSSKTSSNCCCR